MLSLDLGDAQSNKDMKTRVNRFKEDNLNISAQMSQRSKRSNKSQKSIRSNVSRKTKGSIASSVPAPKVRAGNPVKVSQAMKSGLHDQDLWDKIGGDAVKDSVIEEIRQSKHGFMAL